MSEPQPPARRTPPKTPFGPLGFERPVGHAVVAMFVALLVGLILNSEGLLATAHQLPYGSTSREVSVAVMRPINDVTSALFLNEPRHGLKWALGRKSQGGDINVFNIPDSTSADPGTSNPGSSGGNTTPNTNSNTNPPPDSSTSGGNTTPGDGNTGLAAVTTPTQAKPLRILVLGDSLAGDFGQSLYDEAGKTGVIKPAGPVDYHISTGLTRPDVFNWPGELQDELNEYHPTTVVLALGLNDGRQTMEDQNGNFLGTGTAGWLKEYSRRVGAMIDLVTRTGARIVYVAPPPVSQAGTSDYLFSLNVQIVKEAKKHPGAASVFLFPKLAVHGQYSQSILVNGKETVVRTADGIHTNSAGNAIIVAQVMKALGTLYHLPKTST
jgi:hypothetical protein